MAARDIYTFTYDVSKSTVISLILEGIDFGEFRRIQSLKAVLIRGQSAKKRFFWFYLFYFTEHKKFDFVDHLNNKIQRGTTVCRTITFFLHQDFCS